jgi:hypothetical protein
MKLCFDIYDVDCDGVISEKDLLEMIDTLSDDMYLSVYSYDILKFIQYFEKPTAYLALPPERDPLKRSLQAGGSNRKCRDKHTLKTLVYELEGRPNGNSKLAPDDTKHQLSFEQLGNVEFPEGVPAILDDVLQTLCAFRYRSNVVEEEQIETTLVLEVLAAKQNSKLSCTDAQLFSLQMAFKRLSRNPSNNFSTMYLTEASIRTNFVSERAFCGRPYSSASSMGSWRRSSITS